MKSYTLIIATFLLTATVSAQSKSELQATITALTAKNDSLTAQLTAATDQNAKYSRLVDTLSVMTGVHVDDLDTVKTVLELRAAARTANTDTLTKVRSDAAKLQLAMDSVSQAYTKLKAECAAATPVTTGDPTTPATTPAATVSGSQTDQLMKLNNMYEQGLLTKDEFMKLKAQLMK